MPLDELIHKRLEKLEHVVIGNGKEGLAEMVRGNTRQLAQLATSNQEVSKAIAELREERKRDAARMEGRIDAFNWLKWALTLLAILVTLGGALGITTLNTQWRTVQEQIQRIPAVPE